MKKLLHISFILSVFIALIFCIGNNKANAQSPYYQKISAGQGLPTSTIYDLFSAEDGYLYLGLETGLARFNGSRFKTYEIIENRSRSLNAIQQDKNGRIWCMNFTNQIFYLEEDTLRPDFTINNVIDKSGPLRDFKITEKGLYFLTEHQLFIKDWAGRIDTLLNIDNSIPNNTFVEIVLSADKKDIFIIDFEYIYSLDKNYAIISKTNLTNGHNTGIFKGDELVISPKGKIENLTIGGENVYIPVELRNNYINHISVIDDDLWLCTNLGLIPWYQDNNAFNSVYFENTRITDIVKDIEGGYWVSSVDRGLFYIPNINLKQIVVSDYNINRVERGHDNSIFIGLGNGDIFMISDDREDITKLTTSFVTELEFLFFDENSNRLISSQGVHDLKNNYDYQAIQLGKNVSSDDRGNFLFNTYNQAILLNSDLTSLPNIEADLESFLNITYYSTYNIPGFTIFRNRSNVSKYDPTSKSFYLGAYDAFRKLSLTEEKIIKFRGKDIVALDIKRYQDKGYLLSTQKDGLLLMANDTIFSYFDTSTGLISNTCIKSEIRDSLIFVLTDKGLNMINTNSNNVTNISAILSIKDLNIFDFKLIKDELFLASDKGLLYIDIPKESFPILPKLNSLNLYRPNEFKPLESSVLPHWDNNIRFIAEALHFQNNGQYTFSYRLNGLDNVWHEQSSENNTFNYLALPSGKYTFELRTLMNGFYSQTYTIPFQIKSPFWSTPLFFITAFLLTVLVSYLIFRRLLAQQRKKQKIKQQLLHSQLVSLRSQMNPHFMFNIVNSVQGLIYANKKIEASNLLGKMSSLMRRVLEVSDQPKISLYKEIEILKNYVELEAARFEEDFHYSIETNIPSEDQELLIPSLIVQPFVENAIKHGLMHKSGVKKLVIEINKKSEKLIEICIEDNGIGRKASQKINEKRKNHNSFASEAIESRISLINKADNEESISLDIVDLMNEDDTPLGTRIIIKINLNE